MLRLVYLGTPRIAVPPLMALIEAGHEIALAVTGADRRRGRGNATTPSPVKAVASEHGIPVSHDVNDVADLGAEVDLGVVVAFGQIIKPNVLERVRLINLHFSLLPRWRGAAPVERAILAGDTETGVCVMAVDEGLDTGGIYASRSIPIGPTATADSLRSELVEVGSELLVEVLDTGLGQPRPQVGEPTYARKFEPNDYRIDWDQPGEMIHRLIRVGGAWTTFRGQRIKIHDAELVDGELRITSVQPAGKDSMSFEAWRNGAQPSADEWFE